MIARGSVQKIEGTYDFSNLYGLFSFSVPVDSDNLQYGYL